MAKVGIHGWRGTGLYAPSFQTCVYIGAAFLLLQELAGRDGVLRWTLGKPETIPAVDIVMCFTEKSTKPDDRRDCLVLPDKQGGNASRRQQNSYSAT